jgi:hypothetical protein
MYINIYIQYVLLHEICTQLIKICFLDTIGRDRLHLFTFNRPEIAPSMGEMLMVGYHETKKWNKVIENAHRCCVSIHNEE